jgi:hypothetical protein
VTRNDSEWIEHECSQERTPPLRALSAEVLVPKPLWASTEENLRRTAAGTTDNFAGARTRCLICHIWASSFTQERVYTSGLRRQSESKDNAVRLEFPKYKREIINDTHGDEKGYNTDCKRKEASKEIYTSEGIVILYKRGISSMSSYPTLFPTGSKPVLKLDHAHQCKNKENEKGYNK